MSEPARAGQGKGRGDRLDLFLVAASKRKRTEQKDVKIQFSNPKRKSTQNKTKSPFQNMKPG